MHLSRRAFMKASLGVTLISVGGSAFQGCGPYSDAGKGAAFEGWNFPGTETRPEMLAVAAAILAANPHNTQPWLFAVSANRIDVHTDRSRALGAMDSLLREMHLAIGCATENAVRVAKAYGRRVDVTYEPTPGDETHVVRLELTPAEKVDDPFVGVVASRRMNKFAYASVPVPASVLAGLAALVDDDRTSLRIFTDPASRARLRTQSIDAVTAITRDAEMAAASHRWWRQTPEEIAKYRDGLDLDIMGLDGTTRALGGTQSTVTVEEANGYWIAATEGRHGTGAGYFVIATRDRNSRTEQILAGRLFQRLHLYLTTCGVDAHTLNMLPEMQDREETTSAAARPFTKACAEWVPAGFGFQMLTRFGYAFERAFHTPRRALDTVLR